MRIAMLLLNRGRGSGEVARAHAQGLVARGHEVTLILPGETELPDGVTQVDVELPHALVPVHEYLPQAGEQQRPVHAMDFETAAAYLPAYERALSSVIDDVDVVVAHHANLTAVAAQRVCARSGKPYVVFVHGTGIEPRHHGGYDDRIWAQIQDALKAADGLLVTTDYVRDALVRPLVEVAPDGFLVLPCGVDLATFRPGEVGDVASRYGLPDTYVVCPGALTAARGPQNVVAASRAYADLAPTVFLGDGEDRRKLEADLGDRGRFLGFVPSADKAWLINAATLLAAAPEKKEHFGIIYVEAMAGGTPPLAYRGGGVDSIVTEDVGILTDRNPDALGRSIRELLSDPTRRAGMGRAARARAETRYDTDQLVERLEAWLEGVLRRRA